MPKPQHKLSLNIDLLKPKGDKQSLAIQSVRWALSAGRYLIVFVEVIVLIAFVTRFKLDSEIADNKDQINQQLPFVKALKNDEALIRQTQFQLQNIKKYRADEPNFVNLLDKVAAETPAGISISNLEFNTPNSNVSIKINGTAQNNDQISTLLYGLRQDVFKNASLDSISLEQGLVNFSISAESTGS